MRYRRDDEGCLTLSWLAGEVQVDLGEADLGIRGVNTWGKYLTVTSPPQRCARQNLLEQDFRARLPGAQQRVRVHQETELCASDSMTST